jgi:hypothetical protein
MTRSAMVSAETAIAILANRALQDKGLRPKLDEHDLTEDDITERLAAHSGELLDAVRRENDEWAQAYAAERSARKDLYEYDELAWRKKVWRKILQLIRPIADGRPPNREALEANIKAARSQESAGKEEYLEAAYTKWGLPLVTSLINDHEDPSYRSMLPATPGPGLAEVFQPEYEVRTAVSTKLSSLFKQMPGGSIGLCGFRGSGKTTLINSICQSDRTSSLEDSRLGFTVSAPVRYEPREFVLYLFGRLCHEVLGIAPDRRPSERRPDATNISARTKILALRLAGLVLMTAGGIVIVAAFRHISVSHLLRNSASNGSLGVLLVYTGLAVAGFSLVLSRQQRRRETGKGPSSKTRRSVGLGTSEFPEEVQQLAQNWLEEIRFQLTYTSGWAGSLSVSFVQASANSSAQAAERQLTLPSIIAGYRSVIEMVTKSSRVFIGIDELDKIGSDNDVELFLNDIKAIFGIKRCFYLVSVSENAMSSFERRGLPFRDIFDSTFDEIVRIDRFRYEQSRQLLKRRTVIPGPFIALCHCVSGGLPRDLIRTARALYMENVNNQLGGSLARVTCALITDELNNKTAAIWVELARIDIEPAATYFKAWFKRVAEEIVSGDGLYKTCLDFWGEARGWASLSRDSNPAGDTADSPKPTQQSQLSSLGLEINAYRYLAATILQFFSSQPSDSELRMAGESAPSKASFEMLAEARLLFAKSPLLAWKMISDFRDAHAMPTIKQPDPCWLGAHVTAND